MTVFIHGLDTSASCTKCQILKDRSPQVVIPSLDLLDINASLSSLEELVNEEVTLIAGASFGGFYAHYLAKKYACDLLLINPIINPLHYIEHVDLGQRDVSLLREAIKSMLNFNANQNYVNRVELLLGLHDTIIDYKEAQNYFRGQSFKYYEDDHSLIEAFRAYTHEKETLLSKYL